MYTLIAVVLVIITALYSVELKKAKKLRLRLASVTSEAEQTLRSANLSLRLVKNQEDKIVGHIDDLMCFAEDAKSEFIKNKLFRQEVEQRVKEKIAKKRKRPKRRKTAS